ncbi:hypothetical protein PSECIP111951_03026 [Pseudoalteromonas holothuriae]|uniref:Uncharacterized protein n=1 Tax=Pseudoalteromonas holothuriae TaxID=2963714 RepID=A0A9W4VW07_9GAMM|nr:MULTISPECIES: DUF6136 family protein [unclassified Pseudoalteromonas]CAH9064017.1 hypothetical protein PSECIP111951_03026 [Pseudoalteromonas sp. CIP111951]CAH9066773.1 hypothetical protein PSECIP111854_03956 [Pseudoalteromonas sp. CIP111854]
MNYYQYRKKAFEYALKELLRQLSQFALMISTLFYIFLPGLVAGLFLGLGKVVQSDSVETANQMMVAYLLMQTLLLFVLKPVILDTPHRLFHFSLHSGRLKHLVADFTLLLVSHILLWLSLVLAFAMGWDKLMRAPHFVAFIVTQLSLAVVLLYRPQAVVWALGIAVVLLVLGLSNISYLVVFNAIVLVACWFKPLKFVYVPSQLNVWSFWLVYGLNNTWSLIWRMVIGLLFTLGVAIIGKERPELLHWYAPMVALIVLLLWASMCIKTTKLVQEHRLFWLSLKQQQAIVVTLHAMVFILYLLSWCLIVFVLDFDIFMLLTLLFMPLLQWCAARRPKSLAVCWASVSVLIYMIKILV